MEKLQTKWKLSVYLLVAFASLLVGSCKDAYEDDTFKAYEESPIAILLKSDPENYSLWVEILEKADLYNTLNISTVYTHFAPVNEGVERYLAKLNIGSVAEMSKEDANYLVRYHLIPGIKVDFGQFQSGAISDLNATDDNLYVEFREGGLDAVYLNGESRFNRFDIAATNGVIHSIDDVLVPLTATILDRLAEERFSLFRETVIAVGLDERLDRIYTETVDEFGNPVQQRFKYTLFAVANATFAKEGIASLPDLLTKLAVTPGSDLKDENNPLYKYVAYHVLTQQRSYTDLGKFPEGTARVNFETLAKGELMNVSDNSAELVVNVDEVGENYIQFIEYNIIAKNGVVHEVDDWMPVFFPARVPIIWEFTDYPDVAANVTQYQNPSLGAQYNKTFTANELTSIIWSSVPEFRSDVLIYRNNRQADGVFYNSVLNHDHFRVTLGESGWIQMNTPTIVRGKYKVTFVWPSVRNATNTGICSFILDNQELYSRLVTSNTSADRRQTQVLGEVEFEETTSHTFRILSLDGKLITMDYLQFDPID
ncbi:DUF5108 domain-containing protein [Sphingobacterium alkalisoli]|uniref:DUF5108 domain-containing protein n=1 Tax=Sphingobacterium alkalisoli TaxID=1874115 RepID=A0A4U0HAS7_9SPHI|nr:fasciclin domain-containing protein [Sphingobacterium alkalisoli]TJY68494.1 DUF5108 domain-containing protein [Sphingobacterium alkalisoli]GGH06094.1 hypothetical protein GCM10011418_02640 [Sphingobacterium alkalisoli]